MLDLFLKHTKPWQVSQWSATVKGMTEVCDGHAQVYEDREQSLKDSGLAELGQAFSTPSKTQSAQRLANARRSSDASRDERAAKRKSLVADALVQKPVPTKIHGKIRRQQVKAGMVKLLRLQSNEVLFVELVCQPMGEAVGVSQ